MHMCVTGLSGCKLQVGFGGFDREEEEELREVCGMVWYWLGGAGLDGELESRGCSGTELENCGTGGEAAGGNGREAPAAGNGGKAVGGPDPRSNTGISSPNTTAMISIRPARSD